MATEDLKNKVANKATGAGASAPAVIKRTMADTLKQMEKQLSKYVPPAISERMCRTALTQYNSSTTLQNCTEASFFGSLLTLAQLGLEPGPLGLAYLVPFRGACTVIIGYKGMIQLVRNSGELATISAVPVYEGDVCEIDIANCTVNHPYNETVDKTDPKKIRFVYAKAVLKDGSVSLEVMNLAEIELIRKRSQAGNNGPWTTDYAEMAKKTVLKRLCKMLPLSIEVQSRIAQDETIRITPDSTTLTSMFDAPVLTGKEETVVDAEIDLSAEEQLQYTEGDK